MIVILVNDCHLNVSPVTILIQLLPFSKTLKYNQNKHTRYECIASIRLMNVLQTASVYTNTLQNSELKSILHVSRFVQLKHACIFSLKVLCCWKLAFDVNLLGQLNVPHGHKRIIKVACAIFPDRPCFITARFVCE